MDMAMESQSNMPTGRQAQERAINRHHRPPAHVLAPPNSFSWSPSLPQRLPTFLLLSLVEAKPASAAEARKDFPANEGYTRAGSPIALLPCNRSVQAPTWNPSRPIDNLRDAHVISRQSVVSTVQLSHEYASSHPTACPTLCICAQCNPPRIPASKPSRATPRSSRRRGTAFNFNVLTFKRHNVEPSIRISLLH
ncbi:hypothetical protein B0H14DRAFT_2634921 [Mycena olivaceomarginata]|nr:hypothetical protein B0H14DRAFT_2634921 [Mycena olivaceomarginata]